MPSDKALIMSGFKEDCENLIGRFEQADDIRFETFCEIWKDMKFSLIFTGRESYVELLEFCEEALHVCKQFFLMPPRFKEKVAGLYLLYGIYYKMPVDQFKIKVKLQDWRIIADFHNELKTGEHLDANYILCKLISDNAFHFCLFDREYVLERHLRVDDKQQFNPYSILPAIKDLTEKNEVLTVLDELSKKYKGTKTALLSLGESSSSLNLYKTDSAEGIINDIRAFEEKRRNQQLLSLQNAQTQQLPSTSQGRSRKTIEERSLKRSIAVRDTDSIDTESDEDSENSE